MDAMRGILMMLGLVYHSAKLFSTRQDWALYVTHTSSFATLLVDILHIFRMPAFFIVSGYFAAMTLKKYGVQKFLQVRIARIFIPLVVTALTLNSLQALLLTKNGWMHLTLSEYITQGEWVTHLWFLLNLIVYFLLAALFVALFHKRFFTLLESIDKILEKIPFSLILLVILPLVVMGFLALSTLYPIHVILKTELLFRYMPFFLFGMLLFAHNGLLRRFVTFPAWLSLAIMIASILLVDSLKHMEGYSWYIVQNIVFSVGMWSSASLCFYLFKRFADYKSKLFLALSDMSYTVYLFHHLFVIGYGLLLLHFHIEGTVGMLLLIMMVATTSVCIHRCLISKVNILSYLFNGKSLKRA